MKIIFAGTSDFAVPALQQLIASEHQLCAVYTQPDRPAGRGRKLSHSPIKTVALAANIPLLQPTTLTSDQDLTLLSSFAADLMVVVAYGIILPQAILAKPKLGCINIHGSLLPRWRGAAPIQRALMAGDTTTGITIIQITAKLDAGAMLHQEYCKIEAQHSSTDLHDKLAHLGAIGLAKVLKQIDAGTVVATKQEEALVTYASKLDKTEALINWQHTAIAIDRQIRGLHGWPVAQTRYRGKSLRIWRATLASDTANHSAGTVSQQQQRISVATGAGVIDLLEVQLPGKKRLPIQDFLNAHPIDGVVLG